MKAGSIFVATLLLCACGSFAVPGYQPTIPSPGHGCALRTQYGVTVIVTGPKQADACVQMRKEGWTNVNSLSDTMEAICEAQDHAGDNIEIANDTDSVFNETTCKDVTAW